MHPDGGLRRGQADAASRVRRSDGPAALARKDKRHMPRTAYESGEPLPGECGQPPAKTPATAASPTIRSVAPTGDARSQSSEPEADTAIEPARRETDTCPAEQRPISVNADGGERDAPREREPPPADPFEEWKTKETRYYRQRRRDTEGRLSEWTPKLCAGAFGTTLYLGANLAGPPEWTELLGAAWTCWILGLLTWYVSGLTDIRANDTAVNNISRLTAADHNGVAAEKDVFGPWNRRTRWLARLTRFLLLTGVIFALAFAWINIGKIGGPNDHAESGSNTDDTATATPRHGGKSRHRCRHRRRGPLLLRTRQRDEPTGHNGTIGCLHRKHPAPRELGRRQIGERQKGAHTQPGDRSGTGCTPMRQERVNRRYNSPNGPSDRAPT